MRSALGDGYVEALRAVWSDVPDRVDLVMYWWQQSTELLRQNAIRRLGIITTNSVNQTYNRSVLHSSIASDNRILFAIPDHPWVDDFGSASVRIAMIVAGKGASAGLLCIVRGETPGEDGISDIDLVVSKTIINSDLTGGVDVTNTSVLSSNRGLSFMGVTVLGEGFVVTPEQAESLQMKIDDKNTSNLRLYRNGKDLTDKPRGLVILDFYGLSEQQVSDKYPLAYQWVLNRVKPNRVAKSHTKDGAVYAKLWWVFAKPRVEMRKALSGLKRYIATCRTAKHRIFMFLDKSILPDAKIISVAHDDAWILGIVSSKAHLTWSLRTGAYLEDRPNYNNSDCFDKFPFPDCSQARQATIRLTADRLDFHRKRQQSLHPTLTLTRHVQRPGEAPLRRSADGQGEGHPRAGARLGPEADPRRPRRGGLRRLRLAA